MLVSSTVRDVAVKSDDRATVAALRRWLELQNGEREFCGTDYHPGDNVFTFEDGRPPHPDTTGQRFDRRAIAHHFHDLRHPYATDALKAGVRPKVISERIGDADVWILAPDLRPWSQGRRSRRGRAGSLNTSDDD
jgi:integrase